MDGYDEIRIDVHAPANQQGDEEERPQAKTEYWAEYLAGLYPAFLASEDYDARPYAEILQDRFDSSNEKSRLRLQALADENERLQAEVDRLRTTPVSSMPSLLLKLTQRQSDLEVKQKERGYCQKDMEAILKYVTSLQDKSSRIQKQIDEFTRRIAEVGA